MREHLLNIFSWIFVSLYDEIKEGRLSGVLAAMMT